MHSRCASRFLHKLIPSPFFFPSLFHFHSPPIAERKVEQLEKTAAVNRRANMMYYTAKPKSAAVSDELTDQVGAD